jgi:glycosyltransferase involved in cell wall biosynthesis
MQAATQHLALNPRRIQECPDKWVVVHAGSRDNYELPAALHEVGLLEAFVTDWYSKFSQYPSKCFGPSQSSKLGGFLRRRSSPSVPDDLVFDAKPETVAYMLGRKLNLQCASYHRSNLSIGRKAGEVATRLKANLLSTSYYGAAAFSAYSGPGSKVLFQIHPAPRFLRALYVPFLSRGGLYEGLRAETELTASVDVLDRWAEEARLADHIIVSSEFSRRSVISQGFPSARTYCIPYGTDLKTFTPAPRSHGSLPFTVLFVGSKVARKGLHILLETWSRLRPKNARLRIAGANSRDCRILDAFPGIAEELPRLSRSELVNEFQQADLFVMPSLAEGFGHVYLEALACGTPVLGTQNTVVPDLLDLGNCGFSVEAGNADQLATVLDSVLSRPSQLRDMRRVARRVAELHSWSRFRQQIQRTLETSTLFKSRDGSL